MGKHRAVLVKKTEKENPQNSVKTNAFVAVSAILYLEWKTMTNTTSEWRAFRGAVAGHDFTRAAFLLAGAPDLIGRKNGIGETCLHWLAVEDDLDAVKWLFGHGSDLNCSNGFGTPLVFEVALLGYTELFRWLIANGADPAQRDADGQSLKEYLLEHDKADLARAVEVMITEQTRE